MKFNFFQSRLSKWFMIPLMILFFLPGLSYAQEGDVNVSGTVTLKADGSPLPGVSVYIEGTTTGTITDVDGNYSLNASAGDNLIYSFVGMDEVSMIVPDQPQARIDVVMEESLASLDEVVVVGYESKRKADLTGAVSVVKVDEVQSESNASVLGSLQGRVSGMQIRSDGTPGGDNTSVNIRGFSTINDNSPLYVIDGVPTKAGLNTLNPTDIESIQVLKDAASASIYGSRASNGVIIITTKKGKKDKLNVTVDAYAGVQSLRNRIDVLNAYEWGEVYWQAKQNAGEVPAHPQYGNGPEPIMPSYIDVAKEIPAGNTDWVDEVFDPAMMQYYNVGVSNQTDKSSTFFSMSYFDQEGIMQNTGFQRLTGRLNTSFNLLDRLTIGENLMLTYRDQVAHSDPGFTHQVLFQHPLIPVYDSNGNYAGPTDGLGDKRNPVAVLDQNKDNHNKSYRIFGNVFAEMELFEGLKFKTSMGVDYINHFYKKFDPRWQEGTRSVDINYLLTDYKYDLNWTWTNTLSYKRSFGPHDVSAMAGYEAIHFKGEGLWGRSSEFLVEDVDFRYLDAATGQQTTGGWGSESSLLSYFGKVDYTLMDKYLLSGTLRRDGSSRLGAANRTGVFPAVSVGWRISEESFMDKVSMISDLKLRAGYGKTGNQEIDPNAAYTIYRPSVEYANYNFSGDNSTPASGYILDRWGNDEVKWETTIQSNFGVDLGLMNGRVEMTADYFIKETDGMLLNPPLMSVWGEGAAPWINTGKMENSGLETMITYRSPRRADFTYEVGLNYSRIRNEVVELTGGDDFFDLGVARIVPGQPVSVFYGYVADGLFKSIEDIQQHAAQEGITPEERSLGRIRYKDLNNDDVINAEDRKYIGNPHPDFTLGLNLAATYKNFDFSAFVEGVFGNDIYNVHKQMTDFTYWNFNYGARSLDAWSPENPDSDIPAVSTSNFNNEYRTSTYFVEDGSYVKLKSLVLGYTLPKSIANRIKASNIRFYLQGQNLLTLTGYNGMDVEVGAGSAMGLGIDSQFYPHTRNVNLGVNITF